MEEDRIIQIVGNYSTSQVYPEACTKCKNAKYGTYIIDGLCLDCHDDEIRRETTDQAFSRFNNMI